MIQMMWQQIGLKAFETIGVTAGASAPEELVQSVIARLKEFGADSIEELQGLEENMFFEVPKELTN